MSESLNCNYETVSMEREREYQYSLSIDSEAFFSSRSARVMETDSHGVMVQRVTLVIRFDVGDVDAYSCVMICTVTTMEEGGDQTVRGAEDGMNRTRRHCMR